MICRFTSSVFAVLLASATADPFAPAQSKNNGEAAYISKLLRKATPTENSQLRRLDQNVEVDLSGYSIKFMQCQFVKAYDDEVADDEDSPTVLGTQRFATFRLCPAWDCSSCNYNYGEYIIDLETYLESTLDYFADQQDQYCKDCEECANQDQDAGAGEDVDADADNGRRLADCSTCYTTCQNIENMEENGFYDAAEYVQCQQMDAGNDDDVEYYVGPMCSNSGSKIKIGVFTDEDCSEFAEDLDVDGLLEAQAAAEGDANAQAFRLSYHLLKKVHDSDRCITCLVEDEDQDANNDPEFQEVCQNLYEGAAGCEYTHGFNYYDDGNGNAQAVADETTVCDFIKAVNSGAYDERGEIAISSGNVSAFSGGQTTGAQKFLLAALAIGTLGYLAAAVTLHSKLTQWNKAKLSSSDGALA